MMLDVMYGMTPSARMLIRSNAPPENMLNKIQNAALILFETVVAVGPD